MRILTWLRRDLRCVDHTALFHASRDADDGIVAAYVLTPEQWAEHDESPRKIGFWMANLRSLAITLADRNIPLLIAETPRFDGVPDVLFKLATRAGCGALYFNREYEINERTRDDAVTTCFAQEGIAVRRFVDRVIISPGEIRTNSGEYYRVFTPFKKAWVAKAREQGCNVQGRPRKQAPTGIESSVVPQRIEGFDDISFDDGIWPAGEGAAQRRLADFAERSLKSYDTERDLPASDGTSRLSPYVAAGVLSPRQCLTAALDANRGRFDSGSKGVMTWISELIWREFYTHVLAGFPRVSRHEPFQLKTKNIPWRSDHGQFSAWCTGRTGVPIVDAGMRQLNETGWMHNRLRMVVAMFLTKHLLIDWREGERYFMRNLIDGDLASNNGGWQWAASTGTDAAPYFRIFNPYSQSRKFDTQGEYIRRYCRELSGLASDIHEPRDPGSVDYVEPIVDHRSARARALQVFKGLG